MNNRIIDEDIVLIPYFPNEEVTYQWYQDKELCRQVDNMDGTYSMERLQAMYKKILELAAEKGMKEVKAQIYSFNLQSRKMFLDVGFIQQDEEWYTYSL